jgi:hypothetical protein
MAAANGFSEIFGGCYDRMNDRTNRCAHLAQRASGWFRHAGEVFVYGCRAGSTWRGTNARCPFHLRRFYRLRTCYRAGCERCGDHDAEGPVRVDHLCDVHARSSATMPEDRCVVFYKCSACGMVFRQRTATVACSAPYGDKRCPFVQDERDCSGESFRKPRAMTTRSVRSLVTTLFLAIC